MLVKDEVDIVKSVLLDASRWATKIFVLDNGSTDGTWELVQSLKSDVIVPWKQDFQTYHNGLRALVYNNFRSESIPGDWWCFKLDADEFYVGDPKEVLATVPKKYNLVAKKSLDYYLTKSDLDGYTFTLDFEKDKAHIKHIRCGCWSEPRFFRERKGVKWDCTPDAHYPANAGLLAPQTVLVKHYQFRSPAQMQKRLDVRNAKAIKDMGKSFRHVKETKWEELLIDEKETITDDGRLETYNKLPIRNVLKQSVKERVLFSLGNLFTR